MHGDAAGARGHPRLGSWPGRARLRRPARRHDGRRHGGADRLRPPLRSRRQLADVHRGIARAAAAGIHVPLRGRRHAAVRAVRAVRPGVQRRDDLVYHLRARVRARRDHRPVDRRRHVLRLGRHGAGRVAGRPVLRPVRQLLPVARRRGEPADPRFAPPLHPRQTSNFREIQMAVSKVLSPITTSSSGGKAMQATYAKCIEVSKRVRFEIDRDVIRGRAFDFSKKFLPDGLSKIDRLDFLGAAEKRLVSQIQGRTYANMFGLVERFIAPKVTQISGAHWLGDQTAFEALVRFTDEELKHQELFRRIERMVAQGMPGGYTFLPQPNDVAQAVLSKSTWAVLALICHIELFVLTHFRQAIEPDAELSDLWKDVFTFHAREESQHAILDELEWKREDEKLAPEQRDQAVTDLIALVAAVDGILQVQAAADTDYFLRVCGRTFDEVQVSKLRDCMLKAYRWQYIVSGVQDERFQ